MTETNEAPLKKFVVAYEIPYFHTVQVGISAHDAEEAEQIAEEHFYALTLWNNTVEMPLLLDDFEEDGESGHVLEFKATELTDGEWPKVDASVQAEMEKDAAKECILTFLGRVAVARQNGRYIPVSELDEAVGIAMRSLDPDEIGEYLDSFKKVGVRYTQSAKELVGRYGIMGEHEKYSIKDWKKAIVADETRSSYWEWVSTNLKSEANADH